MFGERIKLTICFLFHASLIFSQSIQEFKEIWVKESKEYLLNNQMPLPYLQSGFHHFSRVQDSEMAEGLETSWEKFSVLPVSSIPKSKKFEIAPQFDFDETSYHNPKFLPCYISEKGDNASGDISTKLPRIRKPEYVTSNPLKLNFKFYGNNVSVTYDKLLSLPVDQPLSKEIVADYWKKFIVANSNHLVNQLNAIQNRLGLNDWGYFLLVKACSNAIYPNDESGETLLAWALMIRSGFCVKIGFNQLGSSLLYTSSTEIFGVHSVRINGSVYYIDKPIYSFPITSHLSSHPGANGSIQMNIKQSLNFQGEIQTKKIEFHWDKKSFGFNLKYNPEVIRFLESYPQTDPVVFFNAPFSLLSGESLFKQFKPILAAMRKEEGAAFLQQFVQKVFTYRPYNDLYGYDRFMFPEELLFKDDSNDKGKALLYCWMITNLMNQKAALLEYPGFFSVAIALDQPMDGDNYNVNGRKYTIADPTFENAPIGLVMKDFYMMKPLVTELCGKKEEELRKTKIWKQAMAFGAVRSGTGSDFLKDEYGNSYITGYFKEKSNNSTLSIPSPFIAKFDENFGLVWTMKFRSGTKAFGLELKQLERNEFYLAGSFSGELECNGIKIQSPPSDPDLFFVQFDKDGKVGWMTKSGLDDLEEDAKLFYIIRFSRSGEIQSVQLSNEDERKGEVGFQQNSKEGLCYIASRYQTTGLEKPNEEVVNKSIFRFRQNVSRMRQLGIERTITGISSILNSMIMDGDQLSGTELLAVWREKLAEGRSNPGTGEEILQKIKFLKNEHGIIEINTSDLKPLRIQNFRIFNRSHFKIVPLDNNDLKIKIIDGFEYDDDLLKENVNSIIFEVSTGSLIIDIGIEHQLFTKYFHN
ncbi:MAG: hypothetical protein WCK18_01280 [Prolixibacteraceae bacterium]